MRILVSQYCSLSYSHCVVFTTSQEQQQADLEDEEAGDEIDDEAEGAVDDELFFQESVGAEPEVSLDTSAHNMLTSHIDPVAWKTELERVGPRLRAQQQLASNEWRAHVDQTVNSKSQIEQLLASAQGDLKSLNRSGFYVLVNYV